MCNKYKMKIIKIIRQSSIDVSYTGVVLKDAISENGMVSNSSKLMSVFKIPEGWTPVANHMTINRGSAKTNYEDMIGEEVELKITSAGWDNNAIAVKVDTDISTESKFPHITIAVNECASPVMSNEITNWKDIKPITLRGVIKEVKTNGFILTKEEKEKDKELKEKIRKEKEKIQEEKSKNSPTNIIKSRGLNLDQAIDFLKNETNIPEKAWNNVLKSVGLIS